MERGKRELRREDKVKAINKPKSRRAMENQNKKKVISRIFYVIMTIIILFIIAIFASNVIVFDKNKEINLIINNKNATQFLKSEVLIENNVIYLSKADIANFFDKYIYEEDNKIITTYEKKLAVIGYNENKIDINGSTKRIYAHAIKKGDTTYLPISEMADVYNVEIVGLMDKKVVTMDSLDREQKKAILNSNVYVKSSTGIIAKTIDKAKKGDSVIVISSEKGYTKVRTKNGKIGYVKSKKLENEFTVRENMQEEKQIEGKVNLTWDYYSEYASAPDRSGTKIDGVNVVSPSFFYLDTNGNLRENIGRKGEDYINWAHDNGYKVWPMVSNAIAATENLEITSKIMNSYELRQQLIEGIINKCVKYKLDGINIDFENMKEEDKKMFSRFIIELTPRMKEAGLVTSVDVTAPDGDSTWSLCFERSVIGNIADYIVFMAYDQYGVSSNKPGTTAGYNWVKLSLEKFLKTEEIKPEKIILAVPFYTRIWTTKSDGTLANAPGVLSMKNIDSVIPEDAEKKWDNDLKQNYVEYTDNGNKKQVWLEDMDSLKEKLSLITENNLAGVGSWKKDMEQDEVWNLIKQELSK